jgi:hypothetical protein
MNSGDRLGVKVKAKETTVVDVTIGVGFERGDPSNCLRIHSRIPLFPPVGIGDGRKIVSGGIIYRIGYVYQINKINGEQVEDQAVGVDVAGDLLIHRSNSVFKEGAEDRSPSLSQAMFPFSERQ